LKAVVASVTELKIFDTFNLEDHPAYKALSVAQASLEACFAAFGVRISAMQKNRHFLIPSARIARRHLDRQGEAHI
jgi:hypothetical protein